MTEEVKLPAVSKVLNLRNIITATPINVSGERKAERYVITHVQQALAPFSIYKEELRWNGARWIWEHVVFTDSAFRTSYKDAVANLNFRLHGLGR
jgi:hypothetical protein